MGSVCLGTRHSQDLFGGSGWLRAWAGRSPESQCGSARIKNRRLPKTAGDGRRHRRLRSYLLAGRFRNSCHVESTCPRHLRRRPWIGGRAKCLWAALIFRWLPPIWSIKNHAESGGYVYEPEFRIRMDFGLRASHPHPRTTASLPLSIRSTTPKLHCSLIQFACLPSNAPIWVTTMPDHARRGSFLPAR